MIQRSAERVLVGTVLVLTAKVLWPVAKTTIRAAAQIGGSTVSSAVRSTRSGMAFAKEELADMVAEAQFERMKRKIDHEMMEP
ncbi:DUF5132 domain-containing protein [Ammoniphilus sp. 3BR4]|uniref:DUF5132 domain-containing protein n=1 Tax=Ammoniphilus sp. 3BR4 TaxID=3158265 RepID=UPI0034668A4F